MKKLLYVCLLMALLSPLAKLSGQCTNIALNKDWDWTLLDPSHTSYYSTWVYSFGGVCKTISSPWLIPRNAAMSNIVLQQDYLPSKGWVLLDKNLVAPIDPSRFPYFMLYNRYTGMLRVFVYNLTADGKSTKAVSVSLSMYNLNDPLSNRESSLMGMYEKNKNSRPSDYYTTNEVKEGIATTVIAQVLDDATWMNFDFMMGFEPNTDDQIFKDSRLVMDIFSIEEATITLSGGMVSTTVDYNSFGANISIPGTLEDIYKEMGGEVQTTPTNSKKIDLGSLQNKLQAAGKKITVTGNKAGAFFKNAKENNEKLISTLMKNSYYQPNSFRQNLLDRSIKSRAFFDDFQKFSKFIGKAGKVVGDIAPAFGIVSKVIGFISGTSPDNKAETAKGNIMQPTLSRSFISINGTISSTLSRQRSYIFVPSTALSPNWPQATINVSSSFYGCPLGVFNIKNAPEATCQKFSYPTKHVKTNVNTLQEPVYGTWNPTLGKMVYNYKYTTSSNNTYNSYKTFNKFSITNDVLPVVNASSGMEIASVSAALFFDYRPIKNNQGGFDNIMYQDIMLPSNTKYATNRSKSMVCHLGSAGQQNGGCYYYEVDKTITNTETFEKNFIYDQLYSGKLAISSYDESLDGASATPRSEESAHTLQTPFVPIECLKGQTIILPADYDVYVRVVAVLKKKNDPSDDVFIFNKTYDIVKSTCTSTSTDFSGYNTYYDYVAGYMGNPQYNPNTMFGNVTINYPYTNMTIKACKSVEIGEGIDLNSTLVLEIDPTCTPQKCAMPSTWITQTSTSCSNGLVYNNNSFRMERNSDQINSLNNIEPIYAYPNPITDGVIHLSRKVNSYTLAKVTGQTVQNGNSTDRIEAKDLEKGLYILHLDNNTFKIVLQ